MATVTFDKMLNGDVIIRKYTSGVDSSIDHEIRLTAAQWNDAVAKIATPDVEVPEAGVGTGVTGQDPGLDSLITQT